MSARILVVVCGIILPCLLAISDAWAQESGRKLVERAEIIVKVEVLRLAETKPSGPSWLWPFHDGTMIAYVRHIATLKGTHGRIYSIMQHQPGGNSGAVFYEGDAYIVGLNFVDDEYIMTGLQLDTIKSTVNYAESKNALENLKTELIAKAAKGTPNQQAVALHELASFFGQESLSTIRTFHTHADPLIRGTSYIARIQLGDFPPKEELLSFLESAPKESIHGRGWTVYGHSDYTGQRIVVEILSALNKSVGLLANDTKDFDYLHFYQSALKIESVRNSKKARAEIQSAVARIGR